MKTAWAIAVLCAAYVWSAATQPARPNNIEADAKAELLALHRDARRAHFARDVDALLATLPDTFTYVRDGKVEIRSKDSMRQRFTEYFRGAEFTAWDDLEPPVIHVSPDGQMGWMIVRVKIAYTKPDAAGKKQFEQTVMAWMSAYEKREGKWLHVANTTTVEPQ
jgi:hypothetical protein